MPEYGPEITGSSPSLEAGASIFRLGFEDEATSAFNAAQQNFDSASNALEDAAMSAGKVADTMEDSMMDMVSAGGSAFGQISDLSGVVDTFNAELTALDAEIASNTQMLTKQSAAALETKSAMEGMLPTTATPTPLAPVSVGGEFASLASAAKMIAEQRPAVEDFGQYDEVGRALGKEVGSAFWTTFWSEKLQSPQLMEALGTASYDDIKALVRQLKITLGDEALTYEFWSALAKSKRGQREFINTLAAEHFQDPKLAESFYETLGSDRARSAFVQDVGKALAEGTIPLWKRPMGELIDESEAMVGKATKKWVSGTLGDFKAGLLKVTAAALGAFALGNLLYKAFASVIEFLEWTLEPLFIPLADAVSEIVTPLSKLVTPLSRVIGAFAQAIVPPFVALIEAFLPVGLKLARVFTSLAQILAPVFEYIAEVIEALTKNEIVANGLAVTLGIALIPALLGAAKATIAFGIGMFKWVVTGLKSYIGWGKSAVAMLTGQTVATTANTTATAANSVASVANTTAMTAQATSASTAAAAVTANTTAVGANTTVTTASTVGLWARITALGATIASMTGLTGGFIANTVAMVVNKGVLIAGAIASYAVAAAQGILAFTTGILTGAFAALNAVLFANPLVWILGIIALVVAAVYFLVDAIWGWDVALEAIWDVGKVVLDVVLWPIKMALEAIGKAFNFVKKHSKFFMLIGLFPLIAYFKVLRKSIEWVVDAFEYLWKGLKWVGDKIGNTLSSMFDPTKWVESVTKGLNDVKKTVTNWMPGWMKRMFGVPDDNEKKKIVESGSTTVTDFASGLKKATSVLSKIAGGAFSAVSDMLPHSEPKKGPLKGLKKSGARIMENLATGVDKGSGQFEAKVQGSLSDIPIPKFVKSYFKQPDYTALIADPVVSAVERLSKDVRFTLLELSRQKTELRHDASVFARFQI